jgi:CBS domain containing-hemolysin-like protein
MNNEPLIWLFYAGCLVVSFLLSGMEAGLFALSRLRIRQQVRAGRGSARVLQKFLDHPENFLWTILVGNTLANLLVFGWLVKVLHDLVQGRPLWFATAFTAAVFVFYACFDLLPKMLFRTYPNRLCLLLAKPMRTMHLLLRPLVALVESASKALVDWRGGQTFTGRMFGNRDELRQVMQESSQGLTTEERAMINRVLDLPSYTVDKAMTPLDKALTLNADDTVEQALQMGKSLHHTRLPVWEMRDGTRRIAGLLNLDDILFSAPPPAGQSVRERLRPALFIPEDMRLETAMRRMQKGGERLAIVLSRDRREIGLLTLQDTLKVIFGEVNL